MKKQESWKCSWQATRIAELYAVLTTLPVRPRITPDTALRLILEDVRKIARIVALSASEYEATIERLGWAWLEALSTMP